MPTVKQVIGRLFASGTNPGQRSWDSFPVWPPDAFAVAATLVNTSGCYCRPPYMSGEAAGGFFSNPSASEVNARIGAQWGRFKGAKFTASARKSIQKLWDVLTDKRCGAIHDWNNPFAREWGDAVMRLLGLADHACKGIGFRAEDKGHFPIADFVLSQHHEYLAEKLTSLPYVPRSLCHMVPPDEVCVQPKTRTAQVGCTLRSWSHHLSLLPSQGEAATTWLIGDLAATSAPEHQTLNLLLLPFPYEITSDCFAPEAARHFRDADRDRRQWRFFKMTQNWLTPGGLKLDARQFATFILTLVSQAQRECGQVDGVILPELALEESLARDIAIELSVHSNLELFISGVTAASENGGPLQNNCVYSCIFSDGGILTEWTQSKHHRWRLEESQIRRYKLADRLHPRAFWWEYINIENRHCAFYVFRDGMSLVTLICEDLARIDPVQSVIRSVGPNLVVALLMDGPQLKDRWASRYATILADDPGSAVLIMTSMGFLRRQGESGSSPREVVLWKGAEGIPQSVSLQPNHHALLLTLTTVGETNCTLDGRTDDGNTFGLSLSEVRQIAHPSPPPWAVNP